MSDLPTRECPCGATIRQERGAFDDWYNVDDSRGTALYCYPDDDGPDGRARHEPLEESR